MPDRLHSTDLGIANHLVNILLRVRRAEDGGQQFSSAVLNKVCTACFGSIDVRQWSMPSHSRHVYSSLR